MWGMLLPLLAVAGGTYLATQSNRAAAGAVNAATGQVISTDQAIANQGGVGPGASYLRTLVADPNTLTPAQQAQLQDNRRAIANELHGSEFAGSGRVASALFKRQDSDFINSALEANRGRAVGAADTLASTSSGAINNANNALMTGAETTANADLATGRLYGQALGDVSSIINRQSKTQLGQV